MFSFFVYLIYFLPYIRFFILPFLPKSDIAQPPYFDSRIIFRSHCRINDEYSYNNHHTIKHENKHSKNLSKHKGVKEYRVEHNHQYKLNKYDKGNSYLSVSSLLLSFLQLFILIFQLKVDLNFFFWSHIVLRIKRLS